MAHEEKAESAFINCRWLEKELWGIAQGQRALNTSSRCRILYLNAFERYFIQGGIVRSPICCLTSKLLGWAWLKTPRVYDQREQKNPEIPTEPLENFEIKLPWDRNCVPFKFTPFLSTHQRQTERMPHALLSQTTLQYKIHLFHFYRQHLPHEAPTVNK